MRGDRAEPRREDGEALVERGRSRVVVERLSPLIDCGAYPIKRCAGDAVRVEVSLFTDGHDEVAGVLLHRRAGEAQWREAPLASLGNDRWAASFVVREPGRYEYSALGWIDRFASWRRDLRKRLEAGQEVAADRQIGATMIEAAAGRAAGGDREALARCAKLIRSAGDDDALRDVALGDELSALMRRHDDRRFATPCDATGSVEVDRVRACFSAWYELFPRSCSPVAGRHGTLRDCRERLPSIAAMGFDVVYLPPIHPIGRTHRKGRNNARIAERGDVGSPWAIGAAEGGHTSVHPDLGTLDDLRDLVRAAEALGMEIALDIAFQCSPDHPYVKDHPEWFRKRPDGTIQHAENPPKKYEDIVPFDFETDAWRELWAELRRVVEFWVGQGVRIFRVDNPHTKPLSFWEWLIGCVRREHPDVLFLAEAFTRPRVMARLAKIGFSQSYTYFTWRNSARELREYFTQLTRTELAEYFRPNVWPNTPDILTEHLQYGGRPAFMMRAVLAATLGASYGIYGPAFELCEGRAREPGSEEYLDSEKYQLRAWDTDDPDSLRELLTILNRVRREHPALHTNDTLRFHGADNDQLICYSKRSADRSDVILAVVNLDPHHRQSGWIDLDLAELGVDESAPFQAHDLIGQGAFLWTGGRNFVDLDPHAMPAHVFHIRRRVRTERNFDYFL